MSGEDAHLLDRPPGRGHRRRRDVDIGQVGEVETVEPGRGQRAARRRPDPGASPAWPAATRGEVLNVNADTAAAALAVALGAAKLVVLTDVAGLYANWPDRQAVADGRRPRGRGGRPPR